MGVLRITIFIFGYNMSKLPIGKMLLNIFRYVPFYISSFPKFTYIMY